MGPQLQATRASQSPISFCPAEPLPVRESIVQPGRHRHGPVLLVFCLQFQRVALFFKHQFAGLVEAPFAEDQAGLQGMEQLQAVAELLEAGALHLCVRDRPLFAVPDETPALGVHQLTKHMAQLGIRSCPPLADTPLWHLEPKWLQCTEHAGCCRLVNASCQNSSVVIACGGFRAVFDEMLFAELVRHVDK